MRIVESEMKSGAINHGRRKAHFVGTINEHDNVLRCLANRWLCITLAGSNAGYRHYCRTRARLLMSANELEDNV
jgi:hypothetical protein